jgi:hypothetical protein
MFGAINEPVHTLPREPTTVTMARLMFALGADAPPVMPNED